MLNEEGSYYERTLQELRSGLATNRAEIEAKTAELERTEQAMNQIQVSERPCLFCGGKMRDLAPLLSIDLFVHGNPATHIGHATAVYDQPRLPQSWECQTCRAFLTTPPNETATEWTPDSIPEASTALAALVFDHFSFVTAFAYESTSSSRGWLAQVRESWYFLPGSKEQIIDVLGLTQKQRRKRQR